MSYAASMVSTTFYKWRAKFGGMDASLMARLKAVAHDAISIHLTCRVFGVNEGCYRYQPRLAEETQVIAGILLSAILAAAMSTLSCQTTGLLQYHHHHRLETVRLAGPVRNHPGLHLCQHRHRGVQSAGQGTFPCHQPAL
jgi:hypothetical protein